MRIEDQVCSLELAQKLKALGVKQVSLFDWFEIRKNKWEVWNVITLMQYWEDNNIRENNDRPLNKFSAFTCAEIGLMLPKARWTQESTMGGFRVLLYDQVFPHQEIYYSWGETEADVRAGTLIHLIESKFVRIEEINTAMERK
jgi:hypothetical protein